MKGSLKAKMKFLLVGLLAGVCIGVAGSSFLANYNPEDEKQTASSVVFEQIKSQNELIGASLNYSIVDKSTDSNQIAGVDIPFTESSFWYRYAGTIKAGVDLSSAEYEETATGVRVTLSAPYIASNTPDKEKTGVLEERRNIVNPIQVADVDAFVATCVAKSEEEALSGDLFANAKANVENSIRAIFSASVGPEFTVEFVWRDE